MKAFLRHPVLWLYCWYKVWIDWSFDFFAERLFEQTPSEPEDPDCGCT